MSEKTLMEKSRAIATLFQEMGWTWSKVHAAAGVPTPAEVHSLILMLLDNARSAVEDAILSNVDPHGRSFGTGRLKVRVEVDIDNVEYLLSVEMGAIE